MGQPLRVQNFTVSADGFGSGDGQSLERPFGHADPGVLHAWAIATASLPNRTQPGGNRGLDDYFVRDFRHDIGAEIMGRNTFGPQRGPWQDEQWKGWWGDEPPFHTPVFVMTHHARPSFTLGDTTSHFTSAEPADVLAPARAAAAGRGVRLGGGANSIRQFLDADLVDALHVAVCPIELGSGSRLWQSPAEFDDRFHRDEIPSPSGWSTTCCGAAEDNRRATACSTARDAVAGVHDARAGRTAADGLEVRTPSDVGSTATAGSQPRTAPSPAYRQDAIGW